MLPRTNNSTDLAIDHNVSGVTIQSNVLANENDQISNKNSNYIGNTNTKVHVTFHKPNAK